MRESSPTLAARARVRRHLRDWLGPDPDVATRPVAPILAALWIGLAWSGGGVDAGEWGPWSIVLVVLLATALALSPPAVRQMGPMRQTLLASTLAFTAWNFLSLVWADVPGDAWLGSDKTLMYAISLVLLAAWPRPATDQRLTLGLFGAGIAVSGVVILVKALGDPASAHEDGRLLGPTGYVNGDVALWTMGCFACLYLGATTALPAPLRVVFLGAATLQLDLAVLGQSRSWLIVLPIAIVIALLLARERLRTLLALLIVGVCGAAALNPLLDVLSTFRSGADVEQALDRAVAAVGLSALAATALAVVWVLIDARVHLEARQVRWLGWAASGIAVLLIAVGVGLGLRAVDSPGDWIADQWAEFTRGTEETHHSSRFTGSLGTDRYEIWRIAWGEFLDHPVLGLGSDNYEVAYLQERPNPFHEPRYPHSIPLRLLSQLGVVGAALFLTVAVTGVVLALRRRRASERTEGAAVAGCVMVFAFWLLQGSVDVFWEVPALAAPALGFLGLAGCEQHALAREPRPAKPLGRRRALQIAVGVTLVGALAAVMLPWLSRELTASAARSWANDPEGAASRLRLAADLDPLSAYPLLVEGSIALRRGDLELAERSLERALEREPMSWYANAQLAFAADAGGRPDAARRYLARALELNPQDSLLLVANELLACGLPLDSERFNRLYVGNFHRHTVRYVMNNAFPDLFTRGQCSIRVSS